MPDHLETLRKQLLWRASHRGIKEMDLVIGGFAKEHLPRMTAAELQAFALILDIPDQDLLEWMTKQTPVPEQSASALLAEVLAYRPEFTL